MRAGALRDRIKIQRRVKTQTASGITETWSDVLHGIRWARVIPLSVAARAEYAQVRTEVTHSVEFRDRVAMEIGDYRLVWLTGESRVLELADPPMYPTGLDIATRVAVRQVHEDGG